ncbi:MAG TPA: PD-(D/E)XK nuclease family protein, partial [Labilithrix sp.]|nr:PD-(D/E)XK nuclease family protein [Labilithrix sp.]
VTGLERYARCAFQGHAQVVLAARESELTSELPDAREEGTLIHEALAAAFLATQALWARRPRNTAALWEQGEAAADFVLERWQGHAPLRAVVRLRVRDAVRAVLRVAIEDETWDFALAEQPFGARSGPTWPVFVLEDGDLRLALRGTIDRVDRAHDERSLRVIDYKRSKTTVQASGSGLGETALQVPLYACVASRQLGAPATGAYVPTQARDVGAGNKPSAKAAARMEELVARAPGAPFAEIERRALSLIAAARSGALVPIPASESECRLCDVSGGCRKPRFAMAPVDEGEDEPGRAPTDAS